MTDWRTRPTPVGPIRGRFLLHRRMARQDIIIVGGDLEPPTVIGAYRQGIFPMIVETPAPLLGWWSPDPRGILPLDGLRVTRSLRQSAKRYEVRVDTCFVDVIRACANRRARDGWITPEFIGAYTTLHELGWAHSVEVSTAKGGSPAACTACASTGCSPASRCFTRSATRRRWR